MGEMNALSIRTTSGVIITLSLTNTAVSLEWSNKGKARQEIPHRNVLNASLDSDPRVLKVIYLHNMKKRAFHLSVVEGEVEETELNKASAWAEALMDISYAGVLRCRRLLIFVNPHGGTKQGVSIFEQKVRPIFQAAGCSLEIIQTTHHRHAYDVVKTIPLKYDAIVTVSGDGLIHEVLNGLAHHAEPRRALAVSVAPIPTGSGNGLSLNLLGIEKGFDVCWAALNVVKGLPMKVDLFSFTQGNNRVISFMSQALGLMADLDLGTEHLRWMGDTRFIYGFVKGLVRYKECPIQLSYKLVEKDKRQMAETVQIKNRELMEQLQSSLSVSDTPSQEDTLGDSSLPPLQYINESQDGWTSFDEPMLYFYAGKGPYVGRDLMAFPVSLPNDGLIDITVMAHSSRRAILGAIEGAKEGTNFWHPKIQYIKAHAYRVKPLKTRGHLSIDGEKYPFEEYQVEVHSGLGTFLSLHGHYVSSFQPQPPPKRDNAF